MDNFNFSNFSIKSSDNNDHCRLRNLWQYDNLKLNNMIVILGPNMNFDGLLILILAIMLGPSILLAIIGFAVFKKNKKAAKILFILAAVYLLISLGVCGALIGGF
jgi:hypothetical protein